MILYRIAKLLEEKERLFEHMHGWNGDVTLLVKDMELVPEVFQSAEGAKQEQTEQWS